MFLLAALGVIATFCISSIWSGYVMTVLWSWFIVPVFALPMLGLAQAIGVKLLCNMILAKVPSNDKSDGDFARVVGYAVLVPLLALTIGWVVKQFV